MTPEKLSQARALDSKIKHLETSILATIKAVPPLSGDNEVSAQYGSHDFTVDATFLTADEFNRLRSFYEQALEAKLAELKSKFAAL